MTKSALNILVFDIGGTNLRAAIFDTASFAVSTPIIKPTPNNLGENSRTKEILYLDLISLILSTANELTTDTPVDAICIAFPGPINNSMQILAAPGIWGKNPSGPIDIVSHLKESWADVPVFVLNDITAAGYRYTSETRQTFYITTVSTGIGSKLFTNGQPQLGADGAGGEIGHLKVLHDDLAPICDCGERGHLQAIASGRGTLNYIKQKATDNIHLFDSSSLTQKCNNQDNITNLNIAEAYRQRDAFAVKAIEESAFFLAEVLAEIHLNETVADFLIIGGFALALGEQYISTMSRLIEQQCQASGKAWTGTICFGDNDDLSGLIGAGKYADTMLR